MKFGYVLDEIFLDHRAPSGHPERPARAEAVRDALVKANIAALGTRIAPRPATDEELARVHTGAFLSHLEKTVPDSAGWIDPDTYFSPGSWPAALAAAGSAASLATKVLSGELERAVAVVRPPGHHAMRDRAMGFCLLNNVAVAAAAARASGAARVAIVDWDVHHGNGTQDIFWENERVGFYSLHRSPFYPGTGAADETGGGAAAGTKLNAPIEFGTPRAEIVKRFERDLEFIAAKMRPEFVVISCGFDAHRRDPVGSLGLESEDFAPLTRAVVAVADQYAGGRVVSLLEGGYNAAAVAECMDVHLNELIRGD